MTRRYFWGVYEGNDGDEAWKALHDHFERLAREDDERDTQVVVSDRKATKRK